MSLKLKKFILQLLFFIAEFSCFARSAGKSYDAAKKAIDKHDYTTFEKIVQNENFSFYDSGHFPTFEDELFLDLIRRRDDIAFTIFYKKFGNKWVKKCLKHNISDFELSKYLLKKLAEKENISSSLFSTNDNEDTVYFDNGTVAIGCSPIFKVMYSLEDSNMILKYMNLFSEYGWQPDSMPVPASTFYNGSMGNRFSDNYPILLYAIEQNLSFEVIKFLVEHGVNINRRTKEGKYALKEAYQQGLLDIYNYLKSKNALDFGDATVLEKFDNSPKNSDNRSFIPANTQAPQSTTVTPSAKLKDGQYALSGTNIKMRISLITNLVSLIGGAGSGGIGSSRVQNDKLIVSFSSCYGDFAELNGKTVTYGIKDTETFYGSGTTWSWVGY